MVKKTDRKTDGDKYYAVGKWRGLKKYSCNLCPFDTLSETEIELHIKNVHTPKPERKPITVPILDRYGNLVNEREV